MIAVSDKIFAANWKLHKNPGETREFLKSFTQALQIPLRDRQIVFFPSAPCLEAAAESLRGQSQIQWGAQNSFFEAKGAFTGEISAQVVKDLGGNWILLGHSERRTLFGETDQMIAKKVKFVQSLGLVPMLCIGETLDQREKNETATVLKKQLTEGLAHADKNSPLVIAYEPVWAIGTGRVATPVQVQDTHKVVFEELKSLGFSEKTPILYGGSVKPDNAKELMALPHVHGFLVGGASLEVPSFVQICSS